jgi:hypothetical protein
MNELLTRLYNRLQHRELELEVEEEFRLHIELLQHEYIKRGMSPEDARAATRKRFGDLDQFKNECLQISRRNQPTQRMLKRLALVLAPIGLALRLGSTDLHVDHMGDILIAIAVFGRLLLYVRSLTPTRFPPRDSRSSFSLFNGPQTPSS